MLSRVRRKPTHRNFLDAPVLGIVPKIEIHLDICYAKQSTRCCITTRFGEAETVLTSQHRWCLEMRRRWCCPMLQEWPLVLPMWMRQRRGYWHTQKKLSTEERAAHLKCEGFSWSTPRFGKSVPISLGKSDSWWPPLLDQIWVSCGVVTIAEKVARV